MTRERHNLEISRGDIVLAPCPFCGGEPELANTHTASYWLECECGAQVHGRAFGGHSLKAHQNAKASAIAAWNRRGAREGGTPMSTSGGRFNAPMVPIELSLVQARRLLIVVKARREQAEDLSDRRTWDAIARRLAAALEAGRAERARRVANVKAKESVG